MTETEQALLHALTELDEVVRKMATTKPKPNLLPLFARIDELARDLPPNANPELLHFLHRKSYEKARLLLLGRAAENAKGTCRH
jgi:hypothetical protein